MKKFKKIYFEVNQMWNYNNNNNYKQNPNDRKKFG